MELRHKIMAIGVGILIVSLGLRSCIHDKTMKPIVIGKDTLLEPNHPLIVLPNSGSGHGVTITKKPNGDVVIKPKTLGFSFDPGLYAGIGGAGIGLEIGYWYRWNLLTGVQVYPLVPNAFIGLGYRLPYARLNNLSVYAGITARKEPTIGVFFRFGSS